MWKLFVQIPLNHIAVRSANLIEFATGYRPFFSVTRSIIYHRGDMNYGKSFECLLITIWYALRIYDIRGKFNETYVARSRYCGRKLLRAPGAYVSFHGYIRSTLGGAALSLARRLNKQRFEGDFKENYATVLSNSRRHNNNTFNSR